MNSIKYIILEQLITENRVNKVKTDYPCIPPVLIQYFSTNDPSGNNKYLNWMVKQMWDEGSTINGGIIGEFQTTWRWLRGYTGYYEDDDGNDSDVTKQPTCSQIWDEESESFEGFNGKEFYDEGGWESEMANNIIELVTHFHRFSSSLKEKDINKYNYNNLLSIIEPMVFKSLEKDLSKDITKIYEDKDWLIMSPKSHRASCVYGANTKWCVTMRDDSQYFNRYTKGNFYLMFVIDKNNNKKWAINTEKDINTSDKEEVINIPWHQEIGIHRFDGTILTRHKSYDEAKRDLKRQYNSIRSTTTYWNSADRNINWDTFLSESNLPKNLQDLLKAVESKIKLKFARKKKTDTIPYELNPNPIRLRKGDRVKLLASGYGYYRGDEGIIIKTVSGAPGRQKNVDPSNSGVYLVYVPNRKPYANIKNEIIKDSEGNNINIKAVYVGGNFLEKIK